MEEYLAQLKVLGQWSQSDSAGKKIPQERRDRIVHSLTLIDYVDPIYENSYRTGVEGFPEVAKTMDMSSVDSSRTTFMKMFEKDLLGEEISTNVQALQSAGALAYDNQVKLNRQIAPRLDVQLHARITHLKNDMFMYYGIAAACLAIAIYFIKPIPINAADEMNLLVFFSQFH